MNEIIPIKKDIIFKTKISKITNISVEHDYKINDDLVEGSIFINGTYKMTEASLIEEEFMHEIPFSIALSNKVNKDTINIEISDFKYEFKDYVMSINVLLNFMCEKYESEENDILNNEPLDEYLNNYFDNDNKEYEEKEEKKSKEEKNNTELINNSAELINNIINVNEKYYTYKVYIVRKDDTVESICNKYSTTIESLKQYNDISNIQEGDKIIIFQNQDE